MAVGATLALVAFAPLVLLPRGSNVGPLPGAPNASREVARVTASALRPGHSRTGPQAPEAAGPQTGGALVASGGGIAGVVAGNTAEKPGGAPVFRGRDSIGGQPSGTTVEQPGKAKGHHKAKHHGKAKGHAKSKKHGRIAFVFVHAAKPGHVHPSRSGKHTGRRARAHARAWR
ncbi:MAG TPA: hypothetical protein VGJ34_08800 [Gaiellaceae bacterium]